MADFDTKINRDICEINALLEQISQRRKDLLAAEENTRNLLEIASSVGVNALGVGKIGDDFGHEWPYGTTGSIFTPIKARVDGQPAAWHIAERAGIAHGAGNTGQHQADTTNLVDGVYECRNGHWKRIDN